MEHAIVERRLVTKSSAVLAALMAAGAVAFILRFAQGLGTTTHLSDNYPWGLWIVFDLVWIALAGGAFVTAGIVYLFGGEEFHRLARPAVWMGFLSYSFVVVTLLADLGLPWHFWQLGLQRPEHSAMYEVSWCVTLYVSVLALEFAPAVLERLGLKSLSALWRALSPVYTVLALALFMFLMSHSLWMAILALIAFSAFAFVTRDSYRRLGIPVILVIAAVTFSTMHQSSLGSLFLLMPDKLSPLWWSPILPILFFCSAVASGIALVMLMDILVSVSMKLPFHWSMLSQLGRVLWGVLGVYVIMRLTDVALRGKLGLAFSGTDGARFLLEIVGGGLIPLVFLARHSFRQNKAVLLTGTALAMSGVIFNRLNVVLLGMNPPGTQPGGHVGVYFPSAIEWTLSVSLVAAAFFFFALGVKLLPILPKVGESH